VTVVLRKVARIGPSGTRVSKAAEKMMTRNRPYVASHSAAVISLPLTAEFTNPKMWQETIETFIAHDI
jgi:hypothetical protein